MGIEENAHEEEMYFDLLYNFAQVAVKANDMALDGYTPKQIAKKLKKSAEAFYLLCDLKDAPDQRQSEPLPELPAKPETQPEQEQLPENFAKDENGWLLCPVCRKRLLKLTSTTKIVNCPVYCKSCKAEYVVSWWNVENKEILYTRYVNNKHYINRADIRSYGMQGTGVSQFKITRTSATERVAMNL